MFSANENIILRQHKKRIIQYVEETIPENVLDLGTSVMAMEVKCRDPGCVPIETMIMVLFPRFVTTSGTAATITSTNSNSSGDANNYLLPGVKESSKQEGGGTFKTKILLPMEQITKDDVLDALPPGFKGGRKTYAKTCFDLRDFVLGRIGGIVGNDGSSNSSSNDVGVVEMNPELKKERQLLATYLIRSLKDYIDNDCVAPEMGQPFVSKLAVQEEEERVGEENENNPKNSSSNHGGNWNPITQEHLSNDNNNSSSSSSIVVKGSITGSKNFIISRTNHDDNTSTNNIQNSDSNVPTHQNTNPHNSSNNNNNNNDTTITSANDWRRRLNMENSIRHNLMMTSMNSDMMIQCLAEREHAPGVRSRGCPCCDPDDIANIVDNMPTI